MDWKNRMKEDEVELKALIDRLGDLQGDSPSTRVERAYALKSLSNKLGEMRSYVEDCLSGRNSFEQSVMEYKMRVEFPLYSHLDSLSMISHEYIDWSCA